MSLLSMSVSGMATPPARAGECAGWLPGPLHDQVEGINGVVLASAVWTPPGAASLLVVGGSFTTAGGEAANNVAAWDGASWRSLGTGTNGSVYALAAYGDELIAGGTFSTAGGVATSRIARWNGSVWQPLGAGLTNSPTSLLRCSALTVFNGALVAGGKFTTAGGLVAKNIATWNGSAWSALGGGVESPNPIDDEVKALRVHNGVLFAGGWFATAGGVPSPNVAQFAGGAWFPMAGGTNAAVNALHTYNSDLVVGGGFSLAGGISAVHVARWTPGGTWATLGSGVGGSAVTSFQPFNGQLVAGVELLGTGLLGWNGAAWVNVGGGVSGSGASVYTLNVFNGRLVAAGTFDHAGAGSTIATNVAQWDTATWSALHAPSPPQVWAFETFGSRLVATGLFEQSTTGLAPGRNIVSWNGETMAPFGSGLNSVGRALKSFTGFGFSRFLVVGGDFTTVDGLAANRIAVWSETDTSVGSWSTMGAGFNGSVYAIDRFNSKTFAGGIFTASGATPLNRIAQWTGSAWIALGSGMNGEVHALKTYNGFLYAGGTFTTAGGVSTGGLARWDGTSWSSVGGFFSGTVYALEVHDGELVIGGFYPGLPGSPNIAKYNGTTYSTLGTGGTLGAVTSLESDGTHVYVAGGLSQAGGVIVNGIARWNAAEGWSDVDGGASAIQSLGAYRGELNVGIGVIIPDGGGAPSPEKGWVRHTNTGVPWIARFAFLGSFDCGQTAGLTVAAAAGYDADYAWRKDGVALTDGPTGAGSTITGATTPQLTITGVVSSDAGAYDCLLSNACGSISSGAATVAPTGACCPADTDGSGEVGFGDLLTVLGGWGACPGPCPPHCAGDVAPDGIGDCMVDFTDLLEVLGGWGPCP